MKASVARKRAKRAIRDQANIEQDPNNPDNIILEIERDIQRLIIKGWFETIYIFSGISARHRTKVINRLKECGYFVKRLRYIKEKFVIQISWGIIRNK